MVGTDLFTAGLDAVIEALQVRAASGGELKASASDLQALCAIRTQQAGPVPVLVVDKKDSRPPGTPPARVGDLELKPALKGHPNTPFVFPKLPSIQDEGTCEERLLALREAVMPCTQCAHLAQTRRHIVYGEGASDAELMLISEAPNIEDDNEGRPFSGDAGALLEKMLVAMGLSRQQVYLTSVLKCRPDVPGDETGSRPPTISELSKCAPYLASQISIIKPKVIVAMGAGAMRALFGSTETVGKLRSHWHDLQGIPVMPTFHPSYLIRNQSNTEKRKVWEDLLQVMERLGFNVSEKQRGFFKPRASA